MHPIAFCIVSSLAALALAAPGRIEATLVEEYQSLVTRHAYQGPIHGLRLPSLTDYLEPATAAVPSMTMSPPPSNPTGGVFWDLAQNPEHGNEGSEPEEPVRVLPSIIPGVDGYLENVGDN